MKELQQCLQTIGIKGKWNTYIQLFTVLHIYGKETTRGETTLPDKVAYQDWESLSTGVLAVAASG
jgi:hypothetical protein